jgi:hypothetical protein
VVPAFSFVKICRCSCIITALLFLHRALVLQQLSAVPGYAATFFDLQPRPEDEVE